MANENVSHVPTEKKEANKINVWKKKLRKQTTVESSGRFRRFKNRVISDPIPTVWDAKFSLKYRMQCKRCRILNEPLRIDAIRDAQVKDNL